MRYLFLHALWALFLVLNQPSLFAAEPQGAPKPLIQVSFERQSIRNSDSIRALIWLSNEGDQTITSLTMHVAAPDFLEWRSDSCSTNPFRNSLSIGPVEPNQVITFAVCMKTESKIIVGEFNTLFTFEYTWQRQDKSGRSFITVEKPLKANLFGSDTVAGVPLALASYVVPGLFFWLVLGIDCFKVPWSKKDVPLGDKLIYSLMVSFGIILPVNFIFPDVNSGISLPQLSIYALLGTLLGALIGGMYVYKRRISDKRARVAQKELDDAKRVADAKLVSSADTDEVLLEKLLELYPDRRKPKAIVSFSDGQEFHGSLATVTPSRVAIVGWFRIDPEKIPAGDRQHFEDVWKEKRLLELVKLAREKKVQIEALNPIYELKAGELQELADQSKTWAFQGQGVRFAGQSDWEPIELR